MRRLLEIEVFTDSRRGVSVVSCQGRLNSEEGAEYLKSKVSGLVPANIVLELKDLEYIDSQGVGTLVSVLNRTREIGGDVKLAGVKNELVRKVLELTKMPTIFQIFDDAQQAVSSFAETSKPISEGDGSKPS
jgi:anti-sigma B factor antagonist